MKMVDVSGKERTERVAIATARLRMQPATVERIRSGKVEKGDVLAAARLAGVMAAKRTPDLIPLCHPIALAGVTVEVTLDDGGASIRAEVKTLDRTGVEMEALTAALGGGADHLRHGEERRPGDGHRVGAAGAQVRRPHRDLGARRSIGGAMFAVLFEVHPGPQQWDAYLGNAKLLRPELEQIDGFVDNIRYRSLTRDGWLLSLSSWRDEKALVRWRTQARHHEIQEKGRSGIFLDYHLRVGQLTRDTRLPPGYVLQEQRLDETQVGEGTTVTLIDARRAAGVGEVEACRGRGARCWVSIGRARACRLRTSSRPC